MRALVVYESIFGNTHAVADGVADRAATERPRPMTPGTLQTTSATRRPLDSMRSTALVAGVLYLVTFVSSIAGAVLLDPVLNNPQYVVGAGSDTQALFGALLDLVNAVACIGTAVVLFSVVKRQHEGLAIGYVASRIVEAVIVVAGVLGVLAVVTLRQPGATGADAATLVVVQRALLAIRGWVVLLGIPVMAGINALLLGSLLYRSRLVPRVIPAIGLIGAPLMISATIGTMLGVNEMLSVWSGLGAAPIFGWELSLGLWLAIKGFSASAPAIVAMKAGAAQGEFNGMRP
jgi:hypothetical protein